MNPETRVRNLIRPPLTGRHVLLLLVTFFAVIFAVNGVFVYVSLQSHPGVTSDDAYRKGLRFNTELDRADRQKAQGWKSELAVKNGVVVFRLSDKAGQPLSGLSVRAVARRPVHDRADRILVLRQMGPGHYRAAGNRLTTGRWNLSVTATRDGASQHRADYAVQVP